MQATTTLPAKGGAAQIEIPAFVTAMLSLMNELTQVMVEENDLIMQRRTKELTHLLPRKQRLTLDYRSSMKLLAAQPDALKSLPDDVRQALRTSARKMAEVADRNGRILRSAVVATQKLLQNIISMIKREALPKTTYSNPQTAHMETGKYSPTCKPVAVNRTA